MHSFLDIVKKRKSIRSFSQKSVDSETIVNILTLATYAPTNCNQQLWNFIIVDNEEIKERLIKEAATNTSIRRVPVVIVVTYDGWNYKEAIQGASLAVGHILLAAGYYGVSTLPMNSYGNDTKVRRILSIPDSEIICCFVSMGYPDERAEGAPIVPRRPIGEVLHRNTFKNKKKIIFSYNPNDWTLDDLRDHQKYYCRKTFLGKEMDIMSEFERKLVRAQLNDIQGPFVDILSYDGAYLKELPDIPLITVDLSRETSDYTKAAITAFTPQRVASVRYEIYDKDKISLIDEAIQTATLIYKVERLSDTLRERIFTQTHASLSKEGVFVIITRKSNIFLSLFYFMIAMILGKDLRKTGIYNFFGPYKPVKMNKLIKQLRNAGFTEIKWSGYFLIPTFYEQIYQMFLQYVKSGGSSYLHREKRIDWISMFLARIVKLQGMRRVGSFGSVAIIICKK